jgi:carboxymethylenebutenolidase
MQAVGKPVEAKVYPSYGVGPRAGHSFCFKGATIWGPDAVSFIEGFAK